MDDDYKIPQGCSIVNGVLYYPNGDVAVWVVGLGWVI